MPNTRARRTRRTQTLLPLSATRLSNTISCWYCDFKISAFNEVLYLFGRKNARFLRIWFTVGVGFSLAALVGATCILLQDLIGGVRILSGVSVAGKFSLREMFGPSPSIPGLDVSVLDAGYVIFSTLISVAVHEFGHAIAAASEGVRIEYLAIFLAVLFPGALVAFNCEMLLSLPLMAELRVYCAGIWHNAVCCAVCGVTLFLLPLILFPFYTSTTHPMVVNVDSRSALSGYLSPGDLILMVDGSSIHDPQQWVEKMGSVGDPAHGTTKKGYCIPQTWIQESVNALIEDGATICPDELTEFNSVSCFGSSSLDDSHGKVIQEGQRGNTNCLAAQHVVKLRKCGNGWKKLGTSTSSCPCLELEENFCKGHWGFNELKFVHMCKYRGSSLLRKDESCLAPVQQLGMTWVEITYSSSRQCVRLRNNSSADLPNLDSRMTNCTSTFVFFGDVLSEAYFIQLTSYQPRLPFSFGLNLPNILEKILFYTFHVSATLVLLNSLPVFFLDGESILRVALCYVTWLSRWRNQALKICLWAGSVSSIVALSRAFITIVSSRGLLY